MSRRRRRRSYGRENPLSTGAVAGLAVLGIGVVGGLGYLFYTKSQAASTTAGAQTPQQAAQSVITGAQQLGQQALGEGTATPASSGSSGISTPNISQTANGFSVDS